jgi:hypothetical protein
MLAWRERGHLVATASSFNRAMASDGDKPNAKTQLNASLGSMSGKISPNMGAVCGCFLETDVPSEKIAISPVLLMIFASIFDMGPP